MSDHRPVSAEFSVEVSHVRQISSHKLHSYISKIPCVDSNALDLAANGLYESIATFDPESPSGIPLLKLDKSALNFGKVSYV